MGCTEPVAVAYCAAIVRETLGAVPESLRVQVSPNIIKNAKSVVVPHTGGLKGIDAAAAAGIIAGDADRKLDVLSDTDPGQYSEIEAFAELDKRGEARSPDGESEQAGDGMTVAEILEYIREVPIEEIRTLIERQIDYNTSIAKEGLAGDYGANIGSVLLQSAGPDAPVKTRAKAMAAAGSDARMSGCEKPVIIVCGSGNQGITASLPIVEYAKAYGVDHERLLRAVALSDLMAIHLKSGIGTLSAFCGAVCAGCAAGAGIAYLLGGDDSLICHTFVNALGIVSGMICDGAKPSCAAKIAASVDTGILGYDMARNGQEFYSGEGIITKGIEGNIKNIGRLGRLGMEETDKEIMRIMFNQPSC